VPWQTTQTSSTVSDTPLATDGEPSSSSASSSPVLLLDAVLDVFEVLLGVDVGVGVGVEMLRPLDRL